MVTMNLVTRRIMKKKTESWETERDRKWILNWWQIVWIACSIYFWICLNCCNEGAMKMIGTQRSIRNQRKSLLLIWLSICCVLRLHFTKNHPKTKQRAECKMGKKKTFSIFWYHTNERCAVWTLSAVYHQNQNSSNSLLIRCH